MSRKVRGVRARFSGAFAGRASRASSGDDIDDLEGAPEAAPSSAPGTEAGPSSAGSQDILTVAAARAAAEVSTSRAAAEGYTSQGKGRQRRLSESGSPLNPLNSIMWLDRGPQATQKRLLKEKEQWSELRFWETQSRKQLRHARVHERSFASCKMRERRMRDHINGADIRAAAAAAVAAASTTDAASAPAAGFESSAAGTGADCGSGSLGSSSGREPPPPRSTNTERLAQMEKLLARIAAQLGVDESGSASQPLPTSPQLPRRGPDELSEVVPTDLGPLRAQTEWQSNQLAA